MFTVLINYTDFFDIDLLQTIDEFFLNYSISKEPISIVIDKLMQASVLILFLPFCHEKAVQMLHILCKSDKLPRFVFCLSKNHSNQIEEICKKHSLHYFTPRDFTTKLVSTFARVNKTTLEGILSHKDLYLNTITRKCQRSTEMIDLTNQEFYLLKYLLENRERPISKAEFLESVWGFKSTIPTRSLDVYISRLRSKIDGKFDTKYIKTIHCYGYVIS